MDILDIAIVSSVRTAIGKGVKGTLKDTRPDDLGACAVKAAIERAGISPDVVDDVVIGCAMPEAEQGMNFARIIAARSGLPDRVSAATVNRFCSSGLHAIADVAKSLHARQIDVGIGGGAESMSMVPMGGHRLSPNPTLMAQMPEFYVPMGITAERVAKKYDVTREAQDHLAYESHQRALFAQEHGYFDDEIVPLDVRVGVTATDGTFSYQSVRFQKDEGPRRETSVEALHALRPAFAFGGTVTAGNASQISDGAAASVLMRSETAKAENMPILGYFRAFVTAGVPPDLMGIGPVPAVKKLLEKAGIALDDVGVVELNEAFAAQAVYCIRALDLAPQKVNPNGGAIALGHPLGCTGARQVATILHHMAKNRLRYGVVTMCVGGGMGAAGLIELAG